MLRADVGRLSIRGGVQLATGFPDAGVSVQTGDMALRRLEGRVEEHLFLAAVHAALDGTYAYQRSDDWLAVQEADGRWLTSLARQRPDSEDLSETALYAYALTHTPERLGRSTASTIEARVPNRLEFLADVFTADDRPREEYDPPVC